MYYFFFLVFDMSYFICVNNFVFIGKYMFIDYIILCIYICVLEIMIYYKIVV